MVSEFMLQQTTVAAVIPYYERWMSRFPSVSSLAAADEQEVLGLWQGLGYYSRARNLHRAARAIQERHGGRVPRSRDALRSLPGVGDYTAAAVAAFAFDAAEPVIDANIARVLARVFHWDQAIDDARGREFLLRAAQRLLPASGGRLHNSALMELGALICVARTPRCLECPVREECRAVRPETLPVKRARAAIEAVVENRAMVRESGLLWLERSPGPRWKGMWVLPLTEPAGRTPQHVAVHPVTRFKITLRVFEENRNGRLLDGFPADALPPMPTPHRRAVAALLGKGHTR